MVTRRYRLAEDLRALADALEGAEDLADCAVQVGLTCPTEAELQFAADYLGVEVETQSGARVAQKQFGALRIVASEEAFR